MRVLERYKMMPPEIDEFYAALIAEVRDHSIREVDMHFLPESRDKTSVRWKGFVADGNSEAALKEIAAEAIDFAIYNLLRAVDDQVFHIRYGGDRAETTDIRSQTWGELAATYLGPDGKLARHASERLTSLAGK